jgi:hypothetical protein
VVNGKKVAEERGSSRKMARENASERANQTLREEPTQQPFALQVIWGLKQWRERDEMFLFGWSE